MGLNTVTIPVRAELGSRVRWWNTEPHEDEHNGTTGTLCRNDENGPVIVRFDDLCERYIGHGEVEVIAYPLDHNFPREGAA